MRASSPISIGHYHLTSRNSQASQQEFPRYLRIEERKLLIENIRGARKEGSGKENEEERESAVRTTQEDHPHTAHNSEQAVITNSNKKKQEGPSHARHGINGTFRGGSTPRVALLQIAEEAARAARRRKALQQTGEEPWEVGINQTRQSYVPFPSGPGPGPEKLKTRLLHSRVTSSSTESG